MKRFAWLTLICVLGACSNGHNKDIEKMHEELLNIKSIKDYHAVFIIPSQGCNSCISGAEAFLVSKHNELGPKKILFVITGHSSVKSVVVRFGNFILQNKAIFVDVDHRFDKPPFVGPYPKVLFLDDGHVSNVSELKPESSEDIYKKINRIL